MSRGSHESNVFNYTFTIAKLITLSLIILVGFTYFDIKNFEPFVLEEKGGFMGTILGGSLIFIAFLGFDFITTLA